MKKATILSISLLTIMASAAISPALGNMAAFFSDTGHTLIKLIITLPAIMIIPFSFLSGRLTTLMKRKTVLLAGLVIYVIGGVGGGLVSGIYALLLLRAILGVGVGLILPISTALISDFYKGEEAVKMTGWVAAAGNFGGIIAVILSGGLATFSWRYAFMVYLIGLAPLVLVLRFLPEPAHRRRGNTATGKLPPVVFMAALFIFFIMTVFYAFPTNIALFIREKQMGSAGAAGLALAAVTTSAFIAGTFFSRLRKHLGVYMTTFQAVVMAAGFLLLAFANGIFAVFMGAVLIGFAFGNFYPLTLLMVVKGVPRQQNVRAMAVVSSFVFLGQFFSPVLFDAIGALTKRTDIRFVFIWAAFLMIIAAFSGAVRCLLQRRGAASDAIN